VARSATKNAHKVGDGARGARADSLAAGRHATTSPDAGAKAGGPGTKAGKGAKAKAARKAQDKAHAFDAVNETGRNAPRPAGGATRDGLEAMLAASLGEEVAKSLSGALAGSINESFTEMMAGGLATALEEALADTVATAVARELPGALAVAQARAAAPAAGTTTFVNPAPGSLLLPPAAAPRGDGQAPPPDEHTVELAAARAVWDSLPPRRLPALPGLDLAAKRLAATDPERVGGDWYDVTALSAETIVCDVGDVAGHGPGAGALMAELCHAARAYALLDLPPSRIVSRLTGVLLAGGSPALASTVVARLDLPNGRLTWCNAGHLPPVLVAPDGTVSFLGDVHGPLLGGAAQDADAYSQSTVTMPVGATVLFYTAGLVDHAGRSLASCLDALAAAAGRHLAAGDAASQQSNRGEKRSATGGVAATARASANGSAQSAGSGGGTTTTARSAPTAPRPLRDACRAMLDELSGGAQDVDACLLAARLG
jgi:hypothetical protein